MDNSNDKFSASRRRFIKEGAAIGVGATALAGVSAEAQTRWDRTADVVVIGAGASGLPAAIMARDSGASVILVDANHDIGGHAMLSGGRVPLGGGTSLQKKYGISDSADQVYLDHTNHTNREFRYCDRDLVRVWANENAATFEFLIENGVKFVDEKPEFVNGGTVPRLFVAQVFSPDLNETINGRPGSGVVRPLEKSARGKGVEILLKHRLTRIIRENSASGRVTGITARLGDKDVNIRARKGVVIATGGHTSNVAFRRMFDPRLTEEYQVAGEPWSKQNADGEMLAMDIGASLWGTSNQSNEGGRGVTKTRHIGVRYGYENLRWEPESPMFAQVGGSGLTIRSFQNLILVNQMGRRFWNEMRSLPLASEPTATSGTTERRMAAVQYGRSLTRMLPRARSGIPSRRTLIRVPGSSRPTPSESWRGKSKTRISRSRSRPAFWSKPSKHTTHLWIREKILNSESLARCTRSKNHRSTRHGQHLFFTTH